MPIALLVTMTGVTLSAGLSTQVVSQIKTTERVGDRVAAVQAAQAGLDVALAQIRSAADPTGGNQRKLPCALLSGVLDVAGNSSPIRYQVSVDYFMVDPSGLQDLLPTILPSKVACVVGLGTAVVPAYALLQAKGIGPEGTTSRTLFATYTFHTTIESIPGDKIRVANSALCLGAATLTPAAGDAVRAVDCGSEEIRTRFAYPKNFNLVFAAAGKTMTQPRGLCLQADTQAPDVVVKFQPCALLTDARQQWLFDANAFSYYGTLTGLSRSGYCFNLEAPGVAGSRILLRTGSGACGSPFSNSRNFVPGVDVGPGAAGVNTGQLVNRAEVGRCLDLTNEDVNGQRFVNEGRPPALITYPCKQAFDAVVPWNHRWYQPIVPSGLFTVTGQISTIPLANPGKNIPYCLRTPGASGGRIWVTTCSTGGADLNWTIYGASPLAAEAYQIKDRHGNCVQAVGDSATSAYLFDFWSEVVTRACDGSDLQKWNVPASFSAGPLKALGER